MEYLGLIQRTLLALHLLRNLSAPFPCAFFHHPVPFRFRFWFSKLLSFPHTEIPKRITLNHTQITHPFQTSAAAKKTLHLHYYV
jgi:hypothetical protein